jgi:hypothetical protein
MEALRGHKRNIMATSAVASAFLFALTGCGGGAGGLCGSNAISTRAVKTVAPGQEAIEFTINSVSATKNGNKVDVTNSQPLVGARYEVHKEVGNQLVLQGVIRAGEVIHLDARQVSVGDLLTITVEPPESPKGKGAYGTDANGLGILSTKLEVGRVVSTTVNYVAGGWDGTAQTCAK